MVSNNRRAGRLDSFETLSIESKTKNRQSLVNGAHSHVGASKARSKVRIARGIMLSDVSGALARFQEGLAAAIVANDQQCAAAAWTGAVDAAVCAGASSDTLADLLSLVDEPSVSPPRPDPAFAVRGLLAATAVEPEHPGAPGWRALAETHWQRLQGADRRLQCVVCLAIDGLQRGDLVSAGRILSLGAPRGKVRHLTLLCWAWARAAQASRGIAMIAPRAAVDDAAALAARTNAHILDIPIAIEKVRALLVDGEVETAAEEGERLLRTATLSSVFAGSVRQLMAQAMARQGQAWLALEHAREAVELLATGPLAERAMAQGSRTTPRSGRGRGRRRSTAGGSRYRSAQ